MFIGLGVASLALGAVRGLTQLASSKPAQGTSNPFQVSQTSGSTATQQATLINAVPRAGNIAPATMMSLFEAQSVQPSQDMQNQLINGLYAKLDSDANGSVSEAEFVSSLGAGGANAANAKAVFGAVDKNSDGIVTMDELSSGLRKADGEMNLASSRAIASYLKMDQIAQQARTAGLVNISTGDAL